MQRHMRAQMTPIKAWFTRNVLNRFYHRLILKYVKKIKGAAEKYGAKNSTLKRSLKWYQKETIMLKRYM